MNFHLDKITDFQYTDLGNHLLGTQNGTQIRVNSRYRNHPKLMRAVFYHEIGHLIGLDHLCEVCPFIMSAQNVLYYDEMTDEQWKYQLDVFFGMIKEKNIITIEK